MDLLDETMKRGKPAGVAADVTPSLAEEAISFSWRSNVAEMSNGEGKSLQPPSALAMQCKALVADVEAVRRAVVNILERGDDAPEVIEGIRQRARDEVDAFLLNVVKAVGTTQQRLYKEIDDVIGARLEGLKKLLDSKNRLDAVLLQTALSKDAWESGAGFDADRVELRPTQWTSRSGSDLPRAPGAKLDMPEFRVETATHDAAPVACERKTGASLRYLLELLNRHTKFLPQTMSLVNAVAHPLELKFKRQFCSLDLAALSITAVNSVAPLRTSSSLASTAEVSRSSSSASAASHRMAARASRTVDHSNAVDAMSGAHVLRLSNSQHRPPSVVHPGGGARDSRMSSAGAGKVLHRDVQTPPAPCDLPFCKVP